MTKWFTRTLVIAFVLAGAQLWCLAIWDRAFPIEMYSPIFDAAMLVLPRTFSFVLGFAVLFLAVFLYSFVVGAVMAGLLGVLTRQVQRENAQQRA